MNVAALLTLPGRRWFRRPPATEASLAELRRIAGAALPEEYLELLRYSNGGEGPLALPPLVFMLYDAEFAAEVNSDGEHRAMYPGHFVIGSNGGLETIAFDTESGTPWRLVMYDAVPGVSSAVVIAENMAAFLAAVGLQRDSAAK